MQTHFTDEQLRDPATQVANAVLRSCVHCGMCTATCPTFVLLGDELDSPRGRIYLMKDMLESGRPATEEVVRHVDRCLSCLSCMTTCPSGVNYMHLVDHARAYIQRTYRRPPMERLMRAALAALLPYPERLRPMLKLAGRARPLRNLVPGSSMLASRLRAMLDLAPASLPAPSALQRPGVTLAEGTRKGRVALLAGCAQQVLSPSINEATIRLLTRMGIEVVIAREAGCCGALTHHMGNEDAAKISARANIEAWHTEIANGGLDAIIINTSGCGTVVKDYGFLFRNDSDIAAKAEAIASRALDITEYLQRIGYSPTRGAPNLTVAYHAACSLQHGQRVLDAPKALLRSAGFTIAEPRESHLCCGSAGTYNIMQPKIATRLRRRKLDRLKATSPDVIAAGNIGCLTQLAGDGVPTIHTVELLDWMAGGPAPANLPKAAP